MRKAWTESLVAHLNHLGPRAFSHTELMDTISRTRAFLGIPNRIKKEELLLVLADAGMRDVEIPPVQESADEKLYRTFRRKLWMNPSPEAVALSLRKNSFLSHQTAALQHQLITPAADRDLIVNREQTAKPPGSGTMTQLGIDRAFASRGRATNYVFAFEQYRIRLINGKATGRAAVVEVVGTNGERLAATNLERTILDMTVRPIYSGGPGQVLRAYSNAKGRLDVVGMARLLEQFHYAYPYHQAVGFYLERSGYPASALEPFREKEALFDFYVANGMTDPAFNSTWRVYYPSDLS